MIKLIKNAEVYIPEYIGKNDILIVNDKIVQINENIEINISGEEIEYIDAEGMKVVPGFIDQHVHLIGGGGEGGFHTRTPEVKLSDIVSAGATTLIGLLGTDGTARSVEALAAKAHGLEYEGISTYILTGAYEYPSPTITESVKKDIMFADKVIGVKVAVSDHRSSHMTKEDLKKLISQARTAGMLGGKAGVVVMHMGDEKDGLNMVNEIIEETDLPIKQVLPTHVARNEQLFEQAVEFAKKGGVIDITAGIKEKEGRAIFTGADTIRKCLEQGVPIENITMSSDGNGSFSEYDEDGRLIKIGAAKLDTLYKNIVELVRKDIVNLEEALKLVTSNVSKNLKLHPHKGCLQKGSSADILIMDKGLNLQWVIAKGKILMKNEGITIKGLFEE